MDEVAPARVGVRRARAVGPFLVPLYFAFGVVAALLGELAARQRVS